MYIVYMYIYTHHICMYVYVYAYIHVYINMYTYVYIYECIYIYIYKCLYIHMYIFVYVYLYIYIYIYSYTCMYVCMYIHKCLHMHVQVSSEGGQECEVPHCVGDRHGLLYTYMSKVLDLSCLKNEKTAVTAWAFLVTIFDFVPQLVMCNYCFHALCVHLLYKCNVDLACLCYELFLLHVMCRL